MIKRIISLFLVIALFSTVFSTVALAEEHIVKVLLFSEDFEGYENGEKPDMDIYDSAGNIFVDTIGASKALSIRNVNAISSTTAEKKISRVEGKKVIVSVSFMQTQTGSSNNTVIAFYDGDVNFSIMAHKGAFYIDNNELCRYIANKWYTITSIIDLVNSTAEIHVNGEKKAEGLTIPIKGLEKLAFKATQSPGFYLDNIKIETEQSAKELHIEGVELAAIPKSGKTTYSFSALAKDDNGNKISMSDVMWSYPSYSNVNVIENENILTLEISSDAVPGAFEILASALDGKLTAAKTVNIEQVSAEELKIVGDRRIAGFSGETRTYSYDIAMKDQNGEAISDYGKFTWTMTGVDGYEIPDFISLDANTGEITVTAVTPYREFIKLKATSVDNPAVWQEKKILVTDEHSYVLDNYRYNAVKTHIDNVFVYAKDPYDDNSPLLSDLINVNGKQPAAYIMANNDTNISHNLGAQSALMRSIINLSNFEEEESYRQKVYDIYKYNMDIAPNPTYMYEGGHMSVDLKTKAPNYYENQSRGPWLHEAKGGYIYHIPAFDIDYDRAAIWCKATFLGHAHAGVSGTTDFQNLMISRHWNVASHSLTAETVEQYWNDKEAYDWERKGASTGVSEVQFAVAYSEMLTLFAEYYKKAKSEEEKQMILYWADATYSSLDQTGYNPLTGEYNGLFNQVNGSRYEDDWSNIRTIWETHGKEWYETKKTGLNIGDRLFANTILGDRDLRPVSEGGDGFGPSSNGKSWVNMYYNKDPLKGVNEENWMFFQEPYMMTRENWVLTTMNGLYDFIDVLEEGNELRTKLIEKYTNCIYNYLNLRYDFEESNFKNMMSWGLDLTGWVYPHDGYYGNEGNKINDRTPENQLFMCLATLVNLALKEADNTDSTELATYTDLPNKWEESDNHIPTKKRKEQLEEQGKYIWSVLRNLCEKTYDLGDIGDPFYDEKPDLNFATTSTNMDFVRAFVMLYQISKENDYLKMAQIIANNILPSMYDESAGLFNQKGTLLATTSSTLLYNFLELEAVLIDDYDNLMEATSYTGQGAWADFFAIDDHGLQFNDNVYVVVAAMSEPTSVKQSALVIEDSFSMQIGEKRKIDYKVLPYDAGTGVLWDVSDPEIADITPDGIIKAKRSGTVKVRCVSSSVIGLSSETITVTIE